jgi:hypothetical protein
VMVNCHFQASFDLPAEDAEAHPRAGDRRKGGAERRDSRGPAKRPPNPPFVAGRLPVDAGLACSFCSLFALCGEIDLFNRPF